MDSKEIFSSQHPLVKHLVKLRENRQYRYSSGRVLISGFKLIQELSEQFALRTLLIEKGSNLRIKAKECFEIPAHLFKKITGLENPEPIAAEIDMPFSSDLLGTSFLLILDGVSDPGNLGTLLRTAKALGWDGAFLTAGSADPYNEKAIRAAKGATFTLPWRQGSFEELAEIVQKNNMTLFAADAAGEDFADCPTTIPLALALGNEGHGLDPQLKNRATLIAIPMRGQMESLNVATAGAIMMYQLRKGK